MAGLWKIIKLMGSFIFGSIVVGLIVAISGNIIYERIPHEWKEEMISNLIKFCSIHMIGLVALVPVFFVITIYAWKKEKEDEFRKIWEFYEPVKKLTPENFKIQGYKKAHRPRKSDTTIENSLKNEEYILITGKPKIGKTRASYEAIKKLENFSVIKPKPEEAEIEKIKIPPWSNKNLILFLDDLERFVDKKTEYVIDSLKKKSKKLIVVATCRTGEELDLVKTEMYRQFTTIELEVISENERKMLLEDIKKEDKNFKWNPEQFDGTPGSITLDLGDMKERYKSAKDGKVVLRALKLLRGGNLFLYKESRVKDVCENIFELPPEKTKKYIWDEIINNLKEGSLITMDEGIIDIYAAYLDICVYDYDPSINDLMKLKNMLIGVNDPGSLFYLGNGFLYKNDFVHAKDCHLAALRIYPNYALAHNGLGYASTKLGESEEAKGKYNEAEELYKKAIDEYREAIKIAPSYAANHNNLGYVLTSLGEIKGECDEARGLYQEAVEKHRTAIKINESYPSAHHCLAYALGKLGKDEEAEKEYKKAIELNTESPFAHNLLGHLLANKLGKDEEAEKEYREAIRLKPEYPSAHNNLGYLLAKLRRWKRSGRGIQKSYKSISRLYCCLCQSWSFISKSKKL